MDPVPDRETFMQTVYQVIYDDVYVKLEYENNVFYQNIQSCVKEIQQKINKDWTLDDIEYIYFQLGSGKIDFEYTQTVKDLREYMRKYIASQAIDTSVKEIPRKYTEQVEADFIHDTIDFLGQQYNKTDKRTAFSKSLRKCVELFWKYNVTWQRVQTSATIADIRLLFQMLGTIVLQYESFYFQKYLKDIMRYITDWFHFNEKSSVTQKSAPDLQARVEELEEKFEELQLQVRELLLERPPPLTRQVLLQQLARCT
jgi:hypothetical protein